MSLKNILSKKQNAIPTNVKTLQPIVNPILSYFIPKYVNPAPNPKPANIKING